MEAVLLTVATAAVAAAGAGGSAKVTKGFIICGGTVLATVAHSPRACVVVCDDFGGWVGGWGGGEYVLTHPLPGANAREGGAVEPVALCRRRFGVAALPVPLHATVDFVPHPRLSRVRQAKGRSG